jgi:hypothetical protein
VHHDHLLLGFRHQLRRDHEVPGRLFVVGSKTNVSAGVRWASFLSLFLRHFLGALKIIRRTYCRPNAQKRIRQQSHSLRLSLTKSNCQILM